MIKDTFQNHYQYTYIRDEKCILSLGTVPLIAQIRIPFYNWWVRTWFRLFQEQKNKYNFHPSVKASIKLGPHIVVWAVFTFKMQLVILFYFCVGKKYLSVNERSLTFRVNVGAVLLVLKYSYGTISLYMLC